MAQESILCIIYIDDSRTVDTLIFFSIQYLSAQNKQVTENTAYLSTFLMSVPNHHLIQISFGQMGFVSICSCFHI